MLWDWDVGLLAGPFMMDGKADGWGNIDDNESVRAIRTALDHWREFSRHG